MKVTRGFSRRTALLMVCVASLGGMLTHADQLEFGPIKDGTLYEEDDTTANGSGEYIFAGNTDNGSTRRTAIQFNLSSIPSGSMINSVTLTLYVSRTRAGSVPNTLHRILASWTEGSSNPGGQEGEGAPAELNDVTWRYRSYDPGNVGGSPQWDSLGGEFVPGASATASVGGNGFYSWSSGAMAVDVQAWVDSPASNYGWMLLGEESGQKTAKRYNSRHNTNLDQRPSLLVDFTPPPATGACCFPGETCQDLDISDCNAQGGTFQGEGTTCATTTCVDPVGACCATVSPWGCTVTSEFNCDRQNGTYKGDGELCGPIEAVGGCPVILEPFVDALPIPLPGQPAFGTSGGAATYHVLAQELQQQLHSDLPPTTVWGYGAAPATIDPTQTYASYPGPTIEATTGQPVTVRYFNQLRDTALGGSPPPLRTSHYLNVDTCMHGVDDQSVRIVTHLHGGHVPAASDGYPDDTFLPGDEARICINDPKRACATDTDCTPPGGVCDGDGASCNNDIECLGHGGAENCLLCEPGYIYPNNQWASSIWYHDHALGITRLNVYMGMAGLYLVRDELEASLGLPGPAPQAGDPPGMDYYEIPLVIQDRTFRAVNPLGGLRYPDGWNENFFGDTAMVNGKAWPKLDVDQGKYRFRIYNGSNSRRYVISLDRTDVPGTQDLPFHVIGTDGGLLPSPVTVNSLTLGSAERYDVIVDFACADPPTCSTPVPAGTDVILANSAGSPTPDLLPELMKFSVQPVTGFTGPIPATLRPMETLDPATAVRTRQFLLRKGTEPCAGSRWEIRTLTENGVVVGALYEDITEYPQLGTTEIWEFVNPTVIPHPMHMHLVFFQILNRQPFEIVDDQVNPLDEPIPPSPEEAGWKDTARTEPGQILRVIARFEDYEGLYAYHCHILEHEDHEMMRQFQTIGGVSLKSDATTLTWDPIAGATGYDLVRGDLATLRSTGGDFSAATQACELAGQAVTSFVHTGSTPPLGEGYWYVSRNRDAVGKGTYDSGSSAQVGLRDGEISASGNDCP